jgi:2-dehydro-3-deoxyphosphogluconate aldolase/(4S)-4-hydroxy-2-oxoglutarate aldolase
MSETQILWGDKLVRNQRQVINDVTSEHSIAVMTKEEVDAVIGKIGVIPAVRLESTEDALFAAEALAEAGIPVVEISMADAGALKVISCLVRRAPGMIVGAGSIFNADTASRCLDAGAKFLTSDIFVPGVVELAVQEKITVIPAAFTPTEVMTAWNAGSDFVKVTPCDMVGGHKYIRFLKAAIPQVRVVAAGGVNQLTALNFIKAGAACLSVSDTELIPGEAIWLRQTRRIQELARRFLSAVDTGRMQAASMDGLTIEN